MNLTQYHPLALRTEAPMPNVLARLDHAALGLITEIGEFTTEVKRIVAYGKTPDDLCKDGTTTLRKHLLEELGDTCWYLPIIADACAFTLQEAYDSSPYCESLTLGYGAKVLNVLSGRFSDLVLDTQDGAPLAYGDARQLVGHILRVVKSLSITLGSDLATILQENIAKLELRYPDKFSIEAAEARADKGGLDARNS